MKFWLNSWHQLLQSVAPVRERGLKSPARDAARARDAVAPVRERGLKFLLVECQINRCMVAPVRERGLKFDVAKPAEQSGRSLP